jgi:transcriptional regulator with XRE-family HTH domain
MQDEQIILKPENENSVRPKSQQRIRYEAQLEVLHRKNGGLEDIRQRLGFSQKQMCELLLVDASAWSRWIKKDENAPGHIYQALDWYIEAQKNRRTFKPQLPEMTFIEKTPDIKRVSQFSQTESVSDIAVEEAVSSVTDKLAAWESEKNLLLEKLKRSEQLQAGWKIFLILNSFILFYLIMNQYFSF